MTLCSSLTGCRNCRDIWIKEGKMSKEELLIDKLNNYAKSDMYPFHMPGHKRNVGYSGNPFDVDITEIEGFDNLHHPEEIILECENRAAKLFKSDKTFLLVNGSTCGILTAISAVTKPGDKIIIARNSHQSVYHAAVLRQLNVCYVYPKILEEGIQGEVSVEAIVKSLNENQDAKAVVITSPTYEGIVSDIEEIAKEVHKRNIPVIVDEAHGAHLCISDEFLPSAVELGADIVVNSMHKMLPCFTQTAVLHLKSELVKEKSIRKFLDIYQTSSPSYIFMSNMDKCISNLLENGKEQAAEYVAMMRDFHDEVKNLKNVKVITTENMDISKIVMSVRDTSISGPELNRVLHDDYHLEMEMVTPEYVLAMTSICDTKEGLDRLEKALVEIDNRLGKWSTEEKVTNFDYLDQATKQREKRLELHEAFELEKKAEKIENAAGRVSGGFVYLYPPDIPILVPGEVITRDIVRLVKDMQREGLLLKGIDYEQGLIEIALF